MKNQEFKVGDKVIDILLKEVGVVQNIDYSPFISDGLSVEFKSGLKSYTTNGCYIPECKNPQLLHYRDDYDYDVIDFNNLPKRQKPKRWKAIKGGIYYSFTSNFGVEESIEDNDYLDNETYDSGNYFQTKEEAQEVADKLNEYFQKIIKRKGETYYSFTPNFEVEYFYDYFKTKEEAQEVADKLNKYFQKNN